MTEQNLQCDFKLIVCVYCTKYTTFLEFDMEQHLVENHRLFSKYCNTRSPTMERAITDGKKLGLKVDSILLQQLNKDFLAYESNNRINKYAGVHPDWIPAPVSQEVIQKIQGMKSWSQLRTFTPIVTVEQFFSGDLPLAHHPLEKSPCYPIINFKAAGKYILYSCELHPNIKNINLESLEVHCRYTTGHKEEIISRIEVNK
jgi:hypothetical protein